ncbi:hypothetical protein JW964_22680 [candidate division KSB1 bacterium]|nr:hypothetical protein [candidate division KSB1 bacterium]
MSLKHLSIKDIDDYIYDNAPGERIDDIKQHLRLCENCQRNLKNYEFMMSGIHKVNGFEPGNRFENLVTANLPDMYKKKESPLLEIFSMILISVPLLFTIGFVISRKPIRFISIGNIFDKLSSFFNTITGSLKFVGFIHDNLKVFVFFIVYSLLFGLLNKFFIDGRSKKKIHVIDK